VWVGDDREHGPRRRVDGDRAGFRSAPPDEPERDLGELFARITQRLIEAERPILDRHGLAMWPYIVLVRLARSPASTQQELARQIGYDKTRLIRILDELGEAGLIERVPDPNDRRARIVTVTDTGRERLIAVRAEIRTMESEFLARLSDAQQRSLRRALDSLLDPPLRT
jgi:DNA-binding MarR family transcriptional regulator